MNIKSEIKRIKDIFQDIELRPTVVFLGIPVIIFLTTTFATPGFYYKVFGGDRLQSRLYWFITDGTIMFIISVLLIKLVLKEKLKNFGFGFGDYKFGLITMFLFFVIMIPVLWIVSASPTFASAYPQGGPLLKQNLSLLILYEFCMLIYMLGWEFLWRGFTLFGLYTKFGVYAIFIQMIPFFILHRGKPELELFASIFAGIILGVQAIRARSFIYSWILHWLVMVSIDTISIIRSNLSFYKIF
ncbi:MAG: CPBP family intramembrane metalloprotease [Ignavibacteria bacterium]|nr:CPBP family intramembrane metalloprotease [Ignavibacteria bacterium]